jgi:hypothetical protein
MNQDNHLQDNFDNNTEFNGYMQPMIQTEQSGYSDYSSAAGDNMASSSYTARNYEQQQPMLSFLSSEHANSATQPLYYAPQYADQYISSPLNTLNNSSQSGIFRFEIPGFNIIIVPTSSPPANLDMHNQFQHDHNYLDLSSYTSSVSQSQLNQEQSYVSNVNGSSSGRISANICHQQ